MTSIVVNHTDKKNNRYGPYYELRDNQGGYIETLATNYFELQSKSVSGVNTSDVNINRDNDDVFEESNKITKEYLDYIDDYKEEIEPLNQQQFDTENYTILKDNVREDLMEEVFNYHDIDYKYAKEIFDLIEGVKSTSDPSNDSARLESILAYAKNIEPNIRGDLDPIPKDEIDNKLIESMRIISGSSYGVVERLYGENPKVYRTNHSYSQAKILNNFLTEESETIDYNDNTITNYTMSPEVVDVFSGDTITEVELTKNNFAYSSDVVLPIDMNKNEIEVNLVGNNIELKSNNVNYNSEKLSNKLSTDGINKDNVDFIQDATKKVLKSHNKLDDDTKEKFVNNIVKFESQTRKSIDGYKTVNSMSSNFGDEKDYINVAKNSLKPNFDYHSIKKGEKLQINGEEYTVDNKLEGYGDEKSLELSNEDDFLIVDYKNGVTVDEFNNPISIEK